MNLPAALGRSSRSFRRLSSLSSLLSSQASSNPLKDAIKFPSDNSSTPPLLFTYSALDSHVSALSLGLSSLSLPESRPILSLLPPSSPEAIVLLLASARLGLNHILLPSPSSPTSLPLKPLMDSIEKHDPSMLVLSTDYRPSTDASPGIVAGAHPLIDAVAPGEGGEDSKGLLGMVKETGRKGQRWIVQTGANSIRGTITFKSLLVYSGQQVEGTAGSGAVWTHGQSGDGMTEKDLMEHADNLASKVGMTADRSVKNGKIVVESRVAKDAAAAVVAAISNQTFCVMAGEGVSGKKLADEEQALFV